MEIGLLRQFFIRSKTNFPVRSVHSCAASKSRWSQFLFPDKKDQDFGRYERVIPAEVSSKPRHIPSHIQLPPYSATTPPPAPSKIVEIKTEEQILGMKATCRLARDILTFAGEQLKPGVIPEHLDEMVHEKIIAAGAYPSPLYYKGFPKSICTSVNNVICHGIPDSRPLQDGDIVNVDITVYYKGYHGDCSKTFPIGHVDEKGLHLMEVTQKSLNEAIEICKPGQYFQEIGKKIDSIARKNGLSVVPEFSGHGIGSYFHGPPDIFHFYNRFPGQMKPGMTFTIEPAICQGSPRLLILDDNWTAVTVDGGRSAQFEHTILITTTGREILTLLTT